ncbi:uncharacterized protein LOC132057665 [Lycium ferocissimum]|uniref:uncharacterized protein LOC132057665 n=1 Tax=Lycium ferocissimum TaxID=112874 RepID=UPI002815F4DC|nr:uncharacterized protein LOC132057665 [Lycium ferocissimum]
MEKKMEELLEKSNRSARKATGLRYDDLCMHPDLDLPEGFKIPKFEMFNRTGNPRRTFAPTATNCRSLTKEATEWFATQDIRQWHTWEDMAESFMERFRFNVETVPDRYYLEKVKQKSTENYREFASRWRAEAARVQPPMCEGELVSVFIRSQEPDFYDRMLSMAGRPFAELVKMGEAIEDGLKSGKIVSVFNKASGQATAGIFRKKKEDVSIGPQSNRVPGTNSSLPHTPGPPQFQGSDPSATDFHVTELVGAAHRIDSPEVSMPAVYKMIASTILQNRFKPGKSLGKHLHGITELIPIP